MPPQKNSGGLLDAIGHASTMGLHMVSGVAVGCFVGWALDRWLGTFPWFMAIFFVLGVAAGFYNVWLDTQRLLRAQDTAQQASEAASAAQQTRQPRPPAHAASPKPQRDTPHEAPPSHHPPA